MLAEAPTMSSCVVSSTCSTVDVAALSIVSIFRRCARELQATTAGVSTFDQKKMLETALRSNVFFFRSTPAHGKTSLNQSFIGINDSSQ